MRRYINELLVPEVTSIDKNARGEYSYIELGEEQFDTQMQLLCRFANREGKLLERGFLDVGCGIGGKLFIAAGWESFLPGQARIVGIDNTPEYIEAAKKYRDILAKNYRQYLNEIEFHVADALEYNYAGFKAIYFYRPISNNEKQKQLEERIHKTMDVGSFLLSNLPYHDYEDYYPDWESYRNMPNNFKLLWADYRNKSFIHRKESD